VTCPDGVRAHPKRPVVLLVHGTATTAQESWAEGFGKSLHVSGFDWCMVQLPGRALGDIQASNRYVVAGVRALAKATGRRVALAGHSQGGLQVRWAVRWFPAIRRVVSDVITFAGANDGVASASGVCLAGSCFPAAWQMRQGSLLEAALNREPMPKGPGYTAIYSDTDELVQPTTSGQFAGAANIHLQGLCPGRYVGHVQQVFDAVAIAAALDALTHPGGADERRLGGHCGEVYGPGIDPAQATAAIQTLYENAGVAVAMHPQVPAEPPLRKYAAS
jgi:pimeloyl-ACP methyl ester carboxylesterase